jgi:poly(3-hydroxybutyrate) depolymerase
MAIQYDVAFSASTIGAGIIAGGPYACAVANEGGVASCLEAQPQPPNGEASVAMAKAFEQRGKIDSLNYLKRQKIYLFSGTKDTVVKRSVVDSTYEFYRDAGIPPANIEYIDDLPASHAFIAPGVGNAVCDADGVPFINQCELHGRSYDQPEAILTQIYGHLRPKAAALSAQIVPFDQREFFGTKFIGLAKTGYVYIPADCRRKKCAVHVVFHGCLQNAAAVGNEVYSKLGYNNWADSNQIIMLYPQTDKSMLPFNPPGCWDWWGYTGLDFETQSGAQLAAVHAMVKRLTLP